MSLLEALLPNAQTVLYLGNVALAVVWLCAAALLAAFVCRRRSAPIRHGMLLLGLVLVLTLPALVSIAGRIGIGGLRVAMSVQREPIDKPDTPPDTQLAIADARQESSAMEREVVPGPSAFVGEYQDSVREFPATVPDEPIEVAQVARTEPIPDVDQVVTLEKTASAATAPWWLPVAQGFVMVWALGTAISLLWLVRSFVRLAAFCRGLREDPDDGMRQAVTQAAEQAGLIRAPRLLVSARAVMPVTLGLFRPAIVLPEGFADDLPPDQCRAVLLHEVAHVARRDSWIGLAQRLAVVLYWWCPPVYWLNRRLADLREEVCDNYVLRSQGDGAPFAELLVTLAERVVKPSPLPATVSVFEHHAVGERSHALEHRVRRLLSTETNPMIRMNRVGTVLVALAGLGMAGVIAISHVRAAEADEAVPESGVTASKNTTIADPPADTAAPTKSGGDESERAKLIAEIDDLGGWVASWTRSQSPPVVTVSLSGNTISDAFLERLKVLGDLQVLLLGPSRVTEDGVTHLKGLPHLRELHVRKTPVSDAFLIRLRELPQLEELHLHGNQLRDASLKQLKGLVHLKELSLSRNPITDDGLLHLAALLQLERLYLNGTFVTDAGIGHLGGLPRLQFIGLDGTRISGVGLDQLEKLTGLRHLDLGSTPVADAGLECLGKLTQLSVLGLSRTEVSDTGLEHLGGMTQLTSLNLEGTNISDAGLAHLQGMTRLQTLNLGTQITDAGLEHLSELTQLQTLDLSGTQVTDAGLVHLREMKQLETIDLSRTVITSAGLKHLDGMTQLQTLDLSGTKVTEAGLEHVGGLTRLQTLELPGFPLGDIGLASLQGLSQLRRLDLSDGNVTDSGLRHLRGMSQLESLDLTDTEITDAALQHLSGLTKLQGLHLTNTKITDGGLSHLEQLPELGLLDLSDTRIADDGLAALSSLRLQILLLDNTQVTDAGLVHLLEFTKLRDLDLTGTRVTDDGLRQLGRLSPLRRLRLGKTEVTGTGLVHLCRLTALRSLYLNDSKPDLAAVWEFKRSLPKVSIRPSTLTWGWDNPARTAGVHFTPTSERILAAVNDDTRLEFIETPLDQVMDFLGDQHDIPIQLDKPTLRSAGIGIDVPVTQDLKGITLHSALRFMLGQLGLTYVIRDDALMITTVKEGLRLAQKGIINAQEVGRELEKRGAFRRSREKSQTELLRNVRFQFAETPLADVVAFLKEQHDILFVLDRRALAAAGIPFDVRCTLDVNDMPLGSALQKLLGEVGLTYVVEDEFILITTAKKVAPKEAPAEPAAPRKGADPLGPPEAVGANPFGGGHLYSDEDDSEHGKVIAEIRKRGDVIRDEERPGRPVIGVTLFGNKYTDAFLERLNVLDSVRVLVLAETRVTEAGLTHLKGLSQLRTLVVVGPSVSAAFLDRLQEVSQVRHLCLSVSQLGNADLEHLSASKQLVSLGLTGTLVNDTELFRLGGVTAHQKANLLGRLARLEKRDLPDGPLGDDGLVCLEGLSQLQSLDLRGANLTDSGLRHLRGLSQLQTLDLSETQTADDELTHLRGLTQLTNLNLTGTRITDDGLSHLDGLTRLRLLKLDKTEVTDPAVRRFKRSLPRVCIQPWTLVWNWDNPALDTGVHFTPATKKILSALQEGTRMQFIETPLDEVVAFFNAVHDIPIRLDQPRLRAAGIARNVEVTRDVKGMPLHSTLRTFLSEMGLTYVIDEDALIITTAEEGQRLIRQGKIGAEEVRREFQPEYAYIVTVLQNEVSLQFSATPLEDVVASLNRQHGISIVIDQPALAAAGIQVDVPCTLDVKDVPLASALRKLLGDVGLTYVVDDEFILITTPGKNAAAEENGKSKAPTETVSAGSRNTGTGAPQVEVGEPRTDEEQLAVSALQQELTDLQKEFVLLRRDHDQQSAHLAKIIDALHAMQTAYQTFLATGLGDKEPAVRGWTARTLGELRQYGTFAEPLLTQAQTDHDASVRQAAAKALEQIPRPVTATTPEQPPMQKPRKPAPEQPQGAVAALRREVMQLRQEIHDLGRARDEAFEGVIRMNDKVSRAEAVYRKVLFQAISDEDVAVRLWATRTLGELGRGWTRVTKLLTDAQDDPDEAVRQAAAKALEEIRASSGAETSAKVETGPPAR